MNLSLKKYIGILKNNSDTLSNEYKVKNIGMFGSIASGLSDKHSDIDILVEFSDDIGFFHFIKL